LLLCSSRQLFIATSATFSSFGLWHQLLKLYNERYKNITFGGFLSNIRKIL
jgi:hypothetical protein